METKHIEFMLNDKPVAYDAPADWSLLRLIRDGFGLTGTKCSCNQGECGACTVQLDGKAVNSCMVLAANMNGRSVVTIEGLEENGRLHPLQEAFIAVGAIQCGFCTPGMIMAAKALLDSNPHPAKDEILNALSGNICRCTGYEKIIEAVEAAADGAIWQIEDGVYTRS